MKFTDYSIPHIWWSSWKILDLLSIFVGSENWLSLIANSLPGLRSRSYFGTVGKIDNCKLIIEAVGDRA